MPPWPNGAGRSPPNRASTPPWKTTRSICFTPAQKTSCGTSCKSRRTRSRTSRPENHAPDSTDFSTRTGAVLAPPNPAEVGVLQPDEEAQLALKPVPQTTQIGYLLRTRGTPEETIDEILAMPIISTESGEVIAALVVGFKPLEISHRPGGNEMKSGIWLGGWLHLPALAEPSRAVIAGEVARLAAAPNSAERSSRIEIEGEPHFLFFKRLNPESAFPPAYEVCLYSLRMRSRGRVVCAGRPRRRRGAPACRPGRQPFPGSTPFRAGGATRGRFGGKPRPAKTRRSCARQRPARNCSDRPASPRTRPISSRLL